THCPTRMSAPENLTYGKGLSAVTFRSAMSVLLSAPTSLARCSAWSCVVTTKSVALSTPRSLETTYPSDEMKNPEPSARAGCDGSGGSAGFDGLNGFGGFD